MIIYRCNSCGGVYADQSVDGLAYYHVCPQVLIAMDKYAERSDKRDENAGKKSEGKGRSAVQ